MAITDKIHDELFDWLLSWHYREKSSGGINPYFKLRSRNDERFKKGFWFTGDENYIVVSFWTGGDNLNKTPNIYYELNIKNGLSFKLVARDSLAKALYFEKLANHLGYKKTKTVGIYEKFISKETFNYIFHLHDFITNDKVKIDLFLKNTLLEENSENSSLLQDEYTSKFGFITNQEFEVSLSKVLEERLRKKREVQVTQLSDQSDLPIHLKSLRIEKFYGILQAEINELPGNANWIFLTGINGSGKTRVLKAIALAITNYEENKYYKTKESNIRVEFFYNNRYNVNSSSFSDLKDFVELNNYFAAYGPIRLNVQAESSTIQEGRNSSSVYNLFNSDGLLKNIDFFISQAKTFEFENVLENMKGLVSIITGGNITGFKIMNGRVYYTEKIDENTSIEDMSLDQLASGYRSILNILGDIIIRLLSAQPKAQLHELRGIVIIDEIENHLHPKLQREYPGLLSKIFPKIQFIVSTHSPISILGAPKNSVILNVQRDSEKGVHIERLIKLEKELKNLLPNTILTSDIFNLDDIESVNSTGLDNIHLENKYDDIEKNKQIIERLQKLDKSVFPDNLFKDENNYGL